VIFQNTKNKIDKVRLSVCTVQLKEVQSNENDIPTEKEITCKSAWFQSKNGNSKWQKSISCQKSKGKKKIIRIGRNYVTFSSIFAWPAKGRGGTQVVCS